MSVTSPSPFQWQWHLTLLSLSQQAFTSFSTCCHDAEILQKIGYSCNLVSNFIVSHLFAAEILQSDAADDTFLFKFSPSLSSYRHRIHFHSPSNFISHRWLGGTRPYVLFQNHTQASIGSISFCYDRFSLSRVATCSDWSTWGVACKQRSNPLFSALERILPSSWRW